MRAPGTFRLEHCPACMTETVSELLFVVKGYPIERCQECGLGRSNVGSFDPSAYYTDAYFSGVHPDGYANYTATEPIVRAEFRSLIHSLRKRKANGTLLELGCAYGYFLKEAAGYYDVKGIEISVSAVEACRRNGFDVTPGMVDENSFRGLGLFDVIVMLDVIEHLPKPDAAMALISKHLRPDGIVVLTTGDFSSTYSKLAGRHWRLMTPPQHLWFFSPESLTRLGLAHGLKVVSIEHPWKVVPISLIAYQLQRMLGGRRSSWKLPSFGIPINLGDAMRVVYQKSSGTAPLKP